VCVRVINRWLESERESELYFVPMRSTFNFKHCSKLKGTKPNFVFVIKIRGVAKFFESAENSCSKGFLYIYTNSLVWSLLFRPK
jgi:hypothetical protein